jgi:tetratricopeptide (TPR) repeat protein
MSNIATELHQGIFLYQQGRLDEARVIYEAVLSKAPQCADAWHGLGMIAIVRKDHDRAFQLVSKALDLNPENPTYHQHIAVIHGRLGHFEQAVRHYREVIRLAPSCAEAYFNLSRIVSFEPGDPFVEAIELCLKEAENSDADRCFLHFAAGKYYDDIDQTEQAFAHYRNANDARKAKFDVGATRQKFQSLMTTLTTGWLSHVDRGSSSRLPVFIVGMPRSGTSLVEQILASHPSVVAGGELHDIWEIVQALSQRDPTRRPFPQCLAGIDSNVLKEYADEYLRRLTCLAPTARRVTNKNPTDFRYLGLIAAMFPRARILEVRRDPRDTCLSCYFQNFRNGQEYSFDLQGVGLYYRNYEQLMGHWWAVIPTQLLSVSYESLVTEPEPVIREILAFCGLDWHPACLEPQKASGAVATASRWQVRRPIYRTALSRWKRYETYLGPLLDILESIPERQELTQSGH